MSESGNNDRDSAEALCEGLEIYCSSGLLSEDGLREFIERHGLRLMPNNDNVADEWYDFFGEACGNERVNEGIIRCLLEYFPDTIATYVDGIWTPLHSACCSRSVTLNIIQLLIDMPPPTLLAVPTMRVARLYTGYVIILGRVKQL